MRRLDAHAPQRLAGRAEGVVDGQAERLHRGRLLVADDNDTLAARSGEILGAFRDPFRIGGERTLGESGHDRGQIRIAGQRGDLLSERAQERADLRGLEAHAVVGHASGRGVMCLGHIEAIHRLAWLADAAARHEAAHLVKSAEGRVEEIAVHREDFVRAAEIGCYDSVGAETRGDRGRCFARAERFVFGPKEIRIFLAQLREQSVACGRGIAFDEESEALAAIGRGRSGDFVELRSQGGRVRFCPARLDRFGAVRIVEIEHRSLRKGVRAAIADRMQRVAFEFGRTPVARRGDERHGAVAAGHGRRVVEEFAGDGPLDAIGERNQVSLGTAATGQADAGQRHGAAHQLEEVAAGQFAAMPLGRTLRKLALEFFGEVGRGRQFVETAPEIRTLFAGGMRKDAFHFSDGILRSRPAG